MSAVRGSRARRSSGSSAGSASRPSCIREYGRIVRIWGQTIVPSAVTATLYFVIFGSLIGRRVGPMGGFDYMQYIAPGLIMMAVITNSYANVVSSFFGAKFGKHVEELLVSPLPNWIICRGYVGGVVRGLLVGMVVTGRVAAVHASARAHPLIIVAAVLLTSIVFSLAGFINAMFAQNFDQVNMDPDLHPDTADLLRRRVLFGRDAAALGAAVSYANPILYMVNAFRYGFLGASDVHVGVRVRADGRRRGGAVRTAMLLMERGVGTRE